MKSQESRPAADIHEHGEKSRSIRSPSAEGASAGLLSPKFYVKPQFYIQAIVNILSEPRSQVDIIRLFHGVLEKIQDSCQARLSRDLSEEESRILGLEVCREMRTALNRLTLKLPEAKRLDQTALARLQHIPSLKCHIEKEMLVLHWRISKG